jgi:hypothetical protein
MPPSTDLPVIPLLPLTQITLSLTTLNPLIEVFVPDVRTFTFWEKVLILNVKHKKTHKYFFSLVLNMAETKAVF